MPRIINNTEKIFTPDEQELIKKAMAETGIYAVTTALHPFDFGMLALFDFFDDNDNYVFSIETDSRYGCRTVFNAAN